MECILKKHSDLIVCFITNYETMNQYGSINCKKIEKTGIKKLFHEQKNDPLLSEPHFTILNVYNKQKLSTRLVKR